ncbi:MAG: CoA transferase [Pikeienuella sp.]
MSALTALLSAAGSAQYAADVSALHIKDGRSAIAEALPISDVAAGAYGALALAAADLQAARGGRVLTPVVDRRLAGLAMAGNEYLRIENAPPNAWDPITGYYQCGDGGYVYLHANFPHHRDGLFRVFNAHDRDAMEATLKRWNAPDAEETAQRAGLCCIMLRDRQTWEAHPHRAALSQMPVIAMSDLAEGTRGLDAGAAPSLPLSGVRVLDLSRVIAGPMAGRALAELGADVLRISAPDLPHIPPLIVDTGFNKRAAFADLTTADGRATLTRLIADADVVIDGFRPGALAAKGFGAADIAALNPDISVVTLSAFADVGPWAGRRGYDSYVQGAVGLTAPEKAGDAPVRLACQPLDYLTGCLSAFAAVVMLLNRAQTGGGARMAELSLARTAMWLWDMADEIGPEKDIPARNTTWEEAESEGFLRHLDSDLGAVTSLAPPFGFVEDRLTWRAPQPLGSSAPEWMAR